uniref:30S ribosomal protein 3, chloroplastic-like n=1 Tax=Erigeron canadensis TaxID=72917 RepID=UPI001CB9AD73|nr:30S ribosomal protein 3, chloroplastic-like [Erigeron canadensis]
MLSSTGMTMMMMTMTGGVNVNYKPPSCPSSSSSSILTTKSNSTKISKSTSFSNKFTHSFTSFSPFKTPVVVSATASAETIAAPLHSQKLGVVVKPMEKPRLVLKFIWMEKNIGLALDQVIPGYGTIPVSPYYFWPRKDAWEELKLMLESKPWISQKQVIILLNQATDIINLWQQSSSDSQ